MILWILGSLSGLSALEAFLIILAYAIAIVVAMVGHEYMHSYAAYKMGDNTPKAYGRLTLNPLAHFDIVGLLMFIFCGFGWAKPVPINTLNFRNHKKGTIVTSLAGVGTNFLLAFIFAMLYVVVLAFMPESTFKLFLFYLFYFGMALNISLGIFNLLPIYPLDGFNFVNAFLRYDNKFVDFNRRYGPVLLFIVIIVMYLTGLFSLIIGGIEWLFTEFWALIFGV